MLTKEEMRKLAGQRVTLKLAPQAGLGPSSTGTVVGLIDAADGIVLTFEPDGSAGKRFTVHAHHVVSVKKPQTA